MNTHWTSKREKTSVWGMKIFIWMYRIGGNRLLKFPMTLIIGCYFLCAREARKSSIIYLRKLHAYFGSQSPFQKTPGLWQGFLHFKNFGEAILDKVAVWIGHLNQDDLIREGYENFENLRVKKQGGLILTSHLGNVEVCRAIGGIAKNIPLVVLVHTEHAQKFNDLMFKINPSFALKMIQVTHIHPGIAAQLSQLIEEGSYIVIVGDRTPVSLDSKNILWTSFLGEKAPFSTGPYVLAKILACPVLLLFCLKENKKYRIVLETFCESFSFSKIDRDQVIRDASERFVMRLEHFLRQYPFQWFNFYDFWSAKAASQIQDRM